jgi:hypothetical protein
MAQISHFEHFAKQHLGDDKKRLICSISCNPDTYQNSSAIPLDTYEGERTFGARGGAKMAVILSVENDDPNRFQ